jgi:hypothetical protein
MSSSRGVGRHPSARQLGAPLVAPRLGLVDAYILAKK